VTLVETMLKLKTADSLRLTACGPDGSEMRVAEDLPKAKTPDVRLTVDSPKRAECSPLVARTGSSTMLYAWMQTVMSAAADMERAGFRADRHRAAFKPERS